jgi:hypothetical protein
MVRLVDFHAQILQRLVNASPRHVMKSLTPTLGNDHPEVRQSVFAANVNDHSVPDSHAIPAPSLAARS